MGFFRIFFGGKTRKIGMGREKAGDLMEKWGKNQK
jgi:hypothetical protein